MEDVGGEINAYTSKEETVLYSTFLANHFGRAIELINDIAFFSNFPERKLTKKRLL
jgi:predicted Zn-dependent peptidase